jgi:hypothetical protein
LANYENGWIPLLETYSDSEGGNKMTKDHEHHPVFDYTVDDETYTTNEHILTPKQILVKAGLSTETYYLVQIIGHKQESYKDRPDFEIHMHEHMKFISVFTGETPVSSR